jgi:hypothetical protein
MLTIHKFKLCDHDTLQDQVTIPMPPAAQILRVEMPVADLEVWAIVDDTIKPESFIPRRFRIAGTAHPLQHHHRSETYVGSFRPPHALELIFHVFDEGMVG